MSGAYAFFFFALCVFNSLQMRWYSLIYFQCYSVYIFCLYADTVGLHDYLGAMCICENVYINLLKVFVLGWFCTLSTVRFKNKIIYLTYFNIFSITEKKNETKRKKRRKTELIVKLLSEAIRRWGYFMLSLYLLFSPN